MTEPVELIIFTDGGSRGNPGSAAVGVQVIDSKKQTHFEYSAVIGTTTNNEAEYQAMISSLKWLLHDCTIENIAKVQWYLDSMLVVEQLNGRWKIKQPTLIPLVQQAKDLLAQLPYPFKINHVPRELNRRADALVNQALDAAPAPTI